MPVPAPIAEVWRGPIAESLHNGHIVVSDQSGIIEAWGDPEAIILPRSSAKMMQALPLVATGAAREFGLNSEHLALACASHQGAPLHANAVMAWLDHIGLAESDLRCGPEVSRDKELKLQMIRDGECPNQCHNNCSGKHSGFLTLNKHLGGGSEYVEPDHPVQQIAKEMFESATGMPSPGYGIDGCSAPNFGTSMAGMARAMAFFATAASRDDSLSRAAAQLTEAMIAHPMLVAGQGRACTLLMQEAKEPVALKTGAEGYFIAILPQRGIGVAVKCVDGATRGAECAIAAVLVRMGVLDADHPDVKRFLNPDIKNRAGLVTGQIRPAPGLMA